MGCCQSLNIDGQGNSNQITTENQPPFGESVTNQANPKQITLNQEKVESHPPQGCSPNNSYQVNKNDNSQQSNKIVSVQAIETQSQLNGNIPSLNNISSQKLIKRDSNASQSQSENKLKNFHKSFAYQDLMKKYDIKQTINERSAFSVFILQNKSQITDKSIIIRTSKISSEKQVLMTWQIYHIIDHRNIVQIQGYFEDDIFRYVLEEYYTGGTIIQKLNTLDLYSEKTVSMFMRQVLGSLLYCHIHSIAHRDLKISNFLFQSKKNNQLRLIDFQSACIVPQNKKLTEQIGNYMYIAPEILIGKQYDCKCDIWSVGIILYILLSGSHPFQSSNDQNMDETIQNTIKNKLNFPNDQWNGVSKHAIDLIKKMLNPNPDDRINSSEAYAHPWIQENFSVEHLAASVGRLMLFQENQTLMTSDQFKQLSSQQIGKN